MTRPTQIRGALARVARIAAALACALSAFQLAGCVLEKLNAEMKRQVNAEVDRFIVGDDSTTDQRLVAQAVGAMNGGAYYEAEALLDSALQINPENSVAMLNLGAVYEATDRTEKAVFTYRELADPAGEAVSGDAGLRDADVARIAASRLASLQAGMATPNLRKIALTVPEPPADPRLSHSPARADAASTSAKAEAAPAGKEASDTSTKRVMVTLSTHPSDAAAKGGWDALAARHGAVLENLAPLITPIERDDGKGTAYRLATGPFGSAREAAAFCDKLLARRVYCLISS